MLNETKSAAGVRTRDLPSLGYDVFLVCFCLCLGGLEEGGGTEFFLKGVRSS